MVLLRHHADGKERKLEKAQGQSLMLFEGNHSVFGLSRKSYTKPCNLGSGHSNDLIRVLKELLELLC